ncbi:MAG: class I SAM-dependent methyltransferase, partial [Chloroflexota bacterium]|nr:class I SAM-dependent methyltransferase [Chloroflexota bacterium]
METETGTGGTGLPAGAFDRIDEGPDGRFYDAPRFVQHIDEVAIGAVTAAIRRLVPPGADVLDLMSSWVSHLPPAAELPLGRVVGLGMNAEELEGNPRLDEWTVQDLNADPRLPYPDVSFDAGLITVSVQYLTRPVELFREVARVLRPGGVLIVSFSNRMLTQCRSAGRSRSGDRGRASKPEPLPQVRRGPIGAPRASACRGWPPRPDTSLPSRSGGTALAPSPPAAPPGPSASRP